MGNAKNRKRFWGMEIDTSKEGERKEKIWSGKTCPYRDEHQAWGRHREQDYDEKKRRLKENKSTHHVHTDETVSNLTISKQISNEFYYPNNDWWMTYHVGTGTDSINHDKFYDALDPSKHK